MSNKVIPLKVAVVGATGAVGRELLAILASRKFPISELVPFASARSENKLVQFNGKNIPCQVLKPGCFSGVDIAFFDASDAVSKEWAPEAAKSGSWVVDNSATFRLEDKVPLVIPEVNGDVLKDRIKKGPTHLGWEERIITGPNCSTVQMVVALKPICQKWGLKRVVVSTYQSTSGAGSVAMDELREQTREVLAGKKPQIKAFPHQIAFNAIPHIGKFSADGYTSEEHKMVAESRKLLGLPQLRMSATAVRIPSFSSHAESINVECEKSFDLNEVRDALKTQPGLLLEDNTSENLYPLGIRATGQDLVYVGRVRKDISVDNGLNLWVVSDNLRKGAALNAVQIGEMLVSGP